MTFRQVSNDKICHRNPRLPNDLNLPSGRSTTTNLHNNKRSVHWTIDNQLLIPPRKSITIAINFLVNRVVFALKVRSNSVEQIALDDRLSMNLKRIKDGELGVLRVIFVERRRWKRKNWGGTGYPLDSVMEKI
uniref:Uncharacterized protein n=1 Tax=Cucumis sativus TaxID=3659 RepID=A0A0A0KYU3_CUCSA